MPVDPNIPLSVQTPQPADPIQTFSRIEALKGALQQQQVQGAQLEGLNQENAMRGTQMQQMQKLNDLYRNSLNGDGTIDGGKLQRAMASGGLGSQIPTVMKGVNDYQQSIQNLAKTKLEVGNLQADAAGSMGSAVQAANNDPHLFLTKIQAAVDAKAVDPQQAAPQIQAVQRAMVQDAQSNDPNFSSARKVVAGFTQEMLNGSEKWKTLQSQQQTAQGAAQRGQAALDQAATAKLRYLQGERTRMLGTASDQASWDQARSTLQAAGDDLKGVPAQFSPQAAQTFSGKTAHELTTEQQSASRDQNTQSYRQQLLKQGNQRIDISQQRADDAEDRTANSTPNASGVQGRFDTKEIDAARKQLDQVHQQRTALGAALQTPNGQNYLDPKTGKLSTDEMDDEARAKLQQQYANVTNQGQRIIQQFGDDKSGGRIRSNELPAAAGQPGQPNGQPSPSSTSPKPAATPQSAKPTGNVAPEGTIISNPKTGQRMQKINGQWKPLP